MLTSSEIAAQDPQAEIEAGVERPRASAGGRIARAALVLMAIITTLMAGPLLKLLDG